MTFKAVLAIVFMVGCTSSMSTPDGATGAHKTLTWDADGAHRTGEPLAGASLLQGVLVVSGNDTNGYGIAFSVTATTPGTYDLTHYSGTSFTYTDHTNSWAISTTGGGTGSVVITAFTPTYVTGTFTANPVPTGSATGMPAITNGVFDLVVN